tara:strand:+ start:12808 stop:13026 length:219 start_codon:yes stop_codon:yes gene_type:complete
MTLYFYGRIITPALLDDHLDVHDGYVGDSVKWNVALGYDPSSGPSPAMSAELELLRSCSLLRKNAFSTVAPR